MLPTVEIECGSPEVIYENLSQQAQAVTVQVTVRCKGAESVIAVLSAQNHMMAEGVLKSGETKTFTLAVPAAGGKIRLHCGGPAGTEKCSYTISAERL